MTADGHTTPRRPTGASWGGRAAHWPGDLQLKVRRVPFGRRQLGRRCSPPRATPPFPTFRRLGSLHAWSACTARRPRTAGARADACVDALRGFVAGASVWTLKGDALQQYGYDDVDKVCRATALACALPCVRAGRQAGRVWVWVLLRVWGWSLECLELSSPPVRADHRASVKREEDSGRRPTHV